jgi:serine/threonine-protein kinase
MSNTPSAPQPGQTLAGKYLVEEVLGVGGMGVVVAAKHLQLEQRVAIKYLLPAALLNPEVVERFAREARAAAKIRGEHVARVIDVGQFEDGAPYMVMEHLEGHDLAKHLETHGPLPIEDAIRFLLETCEALAEAHAAKIVHRDLKPSNLFLATQPDKSAIIKVLDFGISKTGDAPSAALTKTSALMGTAFYMSPEQLTSPKGVDHRSDIWALGVILYELLAGRPPFIGESVPEIIGAILTNEPDGIRTLRAEVPLGLELVIAKCMQSKAAHRYQNVAELAAALGPYAHVRDRLSIDITARVLGEPVPATATSSPELGKATLLVAAAAEQKQTSAAMVAQPAPTQHGLPSATSQVAQQLPSVPPPSAPVAVGAVTTHGMSTSQITTKPKRTPTPLIAAAVGIVVVLGAAAAGLKLAGGNAKNDAPPAAATGLVAAPVQHVEPPAPATAATNANGGPTTTLPATSAFASSATSAEVAATPAKVAAPVVAAPRTAAPSLPAKPATPLASAAPPAPASATPPPATPVAAPAASASKNPLQMGIK